jgi:hypothetical protein
VENKGCDYTGAVDPDGFDVVIVEVGRVAPLDDFVHPWVEPSS